MVGDGDWTRNVEKWVRIPICKDFSFDTVNVVVKHCESGFEKKRGMGCSKLATGRNDGYDLGLRAYRYVHFLWGETSEGCPHCRYESEKGRSWWIRENKDRDSRW